MGLPALTFEASHGRALPHLVPVPSVSRRKPTRKTSPRGSAAGHDRAREVFTAFALVLTVLSVLGLARIAVTARAAATSIEAAELRKAIKEERLKGDLLEIQQSSLATPTRIRQIAGTTMQMSEAGGVCYIELDGTTRCEPQPQAADSAAKAAAPARRGPDVIARVLRAALGEAHVLLLGDVGLATSR